jgi:putative component of toxin-antitoxin plasmid stabilization module
MTEHWTVEFYADEEGREPMAKWLDDLSALKRDAVIAALTSVLARLGPDVCGSEWGKSLGQGLYEFRVRHTAEETAAMFAGGARGGKKQPAILLRVFFHAHGQRIILLLGGYDKGRDPSERRQQREIKAARGRLDDFRARRRAALPSNKRAGRGQEAP